MNYERLRQAILQMLLDSKKKNGQGMLSAPTILERLGEGVADDEVQYALSSTLYITDFVVRADVQTEPEAKFSTPNRLEYFSNIVVSNRHAKSIQGRLTKGSSL